ncbi:SDR family NAD(P)-dependent oxidoreductase [Actinacidiphila bryophytorum]|uniref:SDR family NAD(P)-dependent oxidoreductase n=1 Tax=Actinacidiphila bryophytorum TaxID=1436133 RepID=UPI002176EB77|nr:SDR family NAD(P)-dependent oxidoreductase [Actinacidiphila bryophytorum]UWE10407.1 SDR family NAD(P)-dependent oxidoreductase [Actinacidiphila bryophytorum]
MTASTTERKGSALIVGAGPGLGRALADTFAAAGHPIGLISRDRTRLRALAGELTGPDRTVRAYPADARDAQDLRNQLTVAINDLGAPEVLIYNAAAVRQDTPRELDASTWADAFAVNVTGAAVAADVAISASLGRIRSVLFTGGGFALEPSMEYTSLSAGKAALRAYAKALAAEQRQKGVHVTVVTICGFLTPGDTRFDPARVAQTYLDLHHQPQTQWQDEAVYT